MRILEGVDFVEDEEGGDVGAADVDEGLDDGFELLLGVGVRNVEDDQEHVGVGGFFEGGFEAGDEVVGEIADEADGVRDEGGVGAATRAASGRIADFGIADCRFFGFFIFGFAGVGGVVGCGESPGGAGG